MARSLIAPWLKFLPWAGLVLLVVPLVLAAPPRGSHSRSNKCTPSCRKSHDTKLNYQDGKSYIYEFNSESNTYLVGATDESSKLQMRGEAVVTAQSQCDFLLTVQKASIRGPRGQIVNGTDALEGSSIRFAFQDGAIEGICLSEQDAPWSANLKRALVSMLQNKALKNAEESIVSETDISGRCPTQYLIQGDRYVKTRDLNSCTNREGGNTVFYGVPYDVSSKFNSLPNVDSNFTCNQDLRDGVFQSVVCEETHFLESFSNGEAGAQTTIKSTLTLKSSHGNNQNTKSSAADTPASILYDHSDNLLNAEKSATIMTQILTQMCTETQDGVVSAKIPELFLQLQKAMKSIRITELKSLQQQVSSGKLCQHGATKLNKLLLDAAATAVSDAAVALVAEAYIENQLEQETKSYFELYLTFAAQPGIQAIQATGKLLEKTTNPSNDLLLAASGLAYRYCQMTNPSCGDEEDYVQLVDQIAQRASDNCMSRGTTKTQKAIAALQALGNLNSLSPEGVTAIKKCLLGSERIQVRALDAFRRDPCQKDLKEQARDILGDKSRSSEVRIQAYLALSKCMESDDVAAVQTIINKEKSLQVLAFISSHVRNQMRASGPGQQQVKSAFQQLQMPTDTPQDMRKFSRNYEWSLFDAGSNVGGSLEGNVIFSQNSYIPRISSGNVTVHAFGRSYNLVEMGLYLENFEHAFEKNFGPKGSLADTKLGKIFGANPEKLNRFNDQEVRTRSKRSVDESAEVNENTLEQYHTDVDMKKRFGDAGAGDMYLRVMGTSILVETFSQSGPNLMTNSITEGFHSLLQGTKHHKVDLTQPIVFMNDEISVPTISGFPINLNVKGTTVLSLQMSGSLANLEQFFDSSKKDSDKLRVKISPSVATVLKAKMTTGAGPLEAGLQVEGKLQSSSGMEIALERGNGELDIKLNVPQEKQQILSVRTDLFWMEQEMEQLEKKTDVRTKTTVKTIAGPNDCLTSNVIGMKLCAAVELPKYSATSPSYPLSGPSIVSLSVEKTDPDMKGYHVHFVSRDESENGTDETVMSVLVDTPGSKTDRKIEAIAKYRSNPQKLDVQLNSPWKNLNAQYERMSTDKVQGVKMEVSTEGSTYGAKAQIKTTEGSDHSIYEPLVQVYSGSSQSNLLEGKVEAAPGKKLEVTLRTNTPLDMPELDGEMKAQIQTLSSRKFQVKTLEINYPSWGVGKLGLSGTLDISAPTRSLSVFAQYGESGHNLTIDSAFTRIPMQKLALETHVKSSRNPVANLDLNWAAFVHPKTDALEHKFILTQGLDDKKVSVKQRTYYDAQSSKNFEIINHFDLTQSSSQLDFHLLADAKKVAGKSQQYDFSVKSGSDYKAQMSVLTGPDVFFNYKCNATLKYPGQLYTVSETATKTSDTTWKYSTIFQAKPGSRFDAATILTLKDEKNDIEHSVSSTITSDKLAQPIRLKGGFIKKTSSSSAQLYMESEGEAKVDITTAYKYVGGKPFAFDMKALVKNYLTLNLTESHTTTTSQLNGRFKWIPTDRVITAESDFKHITDNVILEGTLKWDAEKDETQMLRIKSNSRYGTTGWSLETTNDITYKGKAVNLQLKGRLSKNLLNGEHFVDLNYRTPSNKNYALYIKNLMESTPRTKSSKLNAKIQLANSQPYQVDWDNRFANFDTERMTFEILSDFRATYSGNQNLNVKGELNSLLTNKRVLNGQYGIRGSAIQNPISFDHSFELKPNGFRIATGGKYGTKASSVDIGVKYDTYSPKKTADLTYKVTLPTSVKSIEGSTRYTYAFNSWRAFEVSEQGSVSINSAVATTWNNIVRVSENEFLASADVNDEGHQLFNFGIQGRKDKKRMVLDISGLVRDNGGKFFSNIEGNFPYYNIRANGSLTLPNSQNYDFKLYHRSAQAGQSFDSELTLLGRGQRFILTNKVENYPKRKSLDILMTDGSTPRKVYVLLVENTPKWNLDSLIKWGDSGKVLTTKGGLEVNKDLLDAVVSVDSPALNMDKWSARVSRKFTNGRHSLAVNVEGRNERVLSLGMEYAKKNERHGETYDGKVKIDAKKGKFNGEFRVENSDLNQKRDGEEGKQVKATVHLSGQKYPLKMTVLTKTTDVEKRVSVSFCNEGDEDCKIGDVIFRHEFHEGNDVDYVLKATSQALSAGKNKTTDGILLTASRAKNGQQFEHIAQLIINEEKDTQIGYRVYHKLGQEFGIELQMPERLISTVGKTHRKNGSEKAELSFWMDKRRKPEDALSIQMTKKDVTSDDAQGTDTSVVLKHPALSKELKFRSKIVRGGENMILDFLAEVDAFKSNGQMSVATKIQRQEVDGGHTYTTDVNAKAENIPLSLEVQNTMTKTVTEMSFDTQVSYNDRNNETYESEVQLSYSDENVLFSVGAPKSNQSTLLLSTVWNNRKRHGSEGHDIRYEIMFPGMADARIFETQIQSSIPPNANIKMYTGNSAKGEFYEAFVGFKSNKQFAAGLYQHNAEQRNVIADWTVSLKSPRLLMVKADWDNENIESALNDAKERLQQTGNRFKELWNSTLDDTFDEVEQMAMNFNDDLPDLTPVVTAYKDEFQEVLQELRDNEDTKVLGKYLAATEKVFQRYMKWVNIALEYASEGLNNAYDQVSRVATGLPDFIKSLNEKIPEMWQDLRDSMDSAVDSVIKGVKDTMSEIQKAIEKITKLTGFDWEFLAENTAEIGKFAQKALDVVVDGVVELFQITKSAVSYIFEIPLVHKTFNELLQSYENILADIVEQVKAQMDALRELILKAFPQKETQDWILAVFEYAEKVVRRVPMNDEAARRGIFRKFMTAIRKAGGDYYSIDWKNGVIVAQIPLPKPIDSLSDFDQLFLIELPTWNLKINQPALTYGIKEIYNLVRTDSLGNYFHHIFYGPGPVVPPMPTYALLIGSEYFRTFDGKFYKFSGSCQYLLASDFVDKNFTIAIDFKRDENKPVKKRILIKYHGDTAIIKPDFTTQIKRNRAASNAELLKTENDNGDGYLDVHSRNGALAVTCSKKYDVCMFTLSGYYHGKSMGLLGTNNHEHHDDFTSPKGQVLESAGELAESWKLNRQCKEHSMSHARNATRDAIHRCKSAFHSKSSTLKSCYATVDPSPFQELCEGLSIRRAYSNQRAVCTASAAYATTCSNSLVNVGIPSGC